MKHYIRQFTKTCTLCMSYAPSGLRPRWLNMPIGTPFETIAIDIWGKLTTTDLGNRYVLVIIDHHTRWVELTPLGRITAESVADTVFDKWISRWGVPRLIVSDNGPQFISSLYDNLCNKYQIRKILTSPFNPRGNSVVESYMRSLKNTVRLCIDIFKTSWDRVLPAAAFAYRTAIHISTGYSPYFLVTGQEAVLPISRELSEPILNEQGETWLEVIWRCRNKLMEDHKRQTIEREQAFSQKGLKFKIGQIIAIKIPHERRQSLGKFAPHYEGPFEVQDVLANGTSARVREIGGQREEVVNRCNAKLLEAAPTRCIDISIPRVILE